MSAVHADFLSSAAGLRGESARRFVSERSVEAPIISVSAQRALFERITTPEVVADVKRILARPDVQANYGAVVWENLPSTAQEIVFDLRYRGDYTPETRIRVQPPLVSGDLEHLAEVMNDRDYWLSRGVPDQRIKERILLLQGTQSLRDAG